MFIPLIKWEQFETSLLRGEVDCTEFLRNRCSSNIDAVGRSAGFLLKHSLRNSLPSGDIDSGTGGLSLITLNIAAAYVWEGKVDANSFSYQEKSIFLV